MALIKPKNDEEKSEIEGNNKKRIESLVFFIVILIITVIMINIIWNGNKANSKQENSQDIFKQLAVNDLSEDINNISKKSELEEKLENILSKVQGVGDVQVFISYSESSEVIAMYNENSKVSSTEESDTSRRN